MRNCPVCGADVFPGASDCPKCGVVFAADGTVSGHDRSHARGRTEERPYTPGNLAWANLSLSVAFISAFFWSPGSRLLLAVFDRPLLQTIPTHMGFALISSLNYCVVAALVYAGLRAAGAERWLRLRPAINTLLAIGNLLLIVYASARIFASTVEGGGGSFVVMSFSPFFIQPARVFFFAALVWLAVHSVQARSLTPPERWPVSIGECVGLAIVLCLPLALLSTLFIGENAPLRLASEARARMAELCVSAGERILLRPTERVRGVFVQHDREDAFTNIRDGRYEDSTNAGVTLVGGLVNLGLLEFYESPFGARTFGDTAEFTYRRFRRGYERAIGTNDAESLFGVFHQDLSTERERKLGIRGTQLTVMDLRTRDVLATTTFFVSTRDRRFCGYAQDGKFSTTKFVIRALALQ